MDRSFRAVGRLSICGVATPGQIQLWRNSDCWRFDWDYHGQEREEARGWVHLSRLILTDAHCCSLRRKPLFLKPQSFVLPPRDKLGSLKFKSFKIKVLRSQNFLAHETLVSALEN